MEELTNKGGRMDFTRVNSVGNVYYAKVTLINMHNCEALYYVLYY
jgi:hypothetical protein